MEINVLLKIIGGVSSGVGSLLLAYRGYVILNWVKYILFAHEKNIDALMGTVYKVPNVYDGEIITGTVNQLLILEGKLGLKLLILGFVLFGAGMLMTALSYFVA
ncbi:hypothetical protein NDN13_05155 [Acinetobacter sp. C32I]|uniref:hypothetical protein n=1 Tax=Acinetobacter sp. C32I TaxID=2950074 RepID=UPI00203728A8|nr:hypothetical protein [Acinetobacter sp. C32I]USA54585.1 hypothetical protein NDN13_05155 [Acinetobacter sp. C32I]